MIARLALLLLALLPLSTVAAPAPATQTPPALVAGIDYDLIPAGQAYAPVKGKIEVVEVFGYTCPHCAHFAPLVSKWKRRQSTDVSLTLIAAPFGDAWTPYAQAFYAAQSLGLAERTHEAVFNAVHVDGTLPRNASGGEIAQFYAKYGVTAERFAAVMASPAIEARMQRALGFIRNAGVDSTPAVVVNGKYRVRGTDFADMLRITDQLVARERAARKR